MSVPLIVLLSIAGYFALLFIIAWLVGRSKEGSNFYGGRKTPWLIAAIASMGAPISGVTFISVPGMVTTKSFSYLQMVLGFVAGFFIVAYVLIPLFYKKNLTSIYGYLEDRYGAASHRTGAWFFFVSKMLGASVRFFVVCVVLQNLVFGPLGVPFVFNIITTIALIFLYTSRGGINTVIWTDTLKSLCLVVSVVLCIVFIAKGLGLGFGSMCQSVVNDPVSRIFFFDNPSEGTFFWKQFLGGMFMLIATTGLDQDLIQRNLHCANIKESQKSLVVSALIQVVIISLFLILGALLLDYYRENIATDPSTAGVIAQLGTTDNLFASVVSSKGIPVVALVLFTIGLVATAYSAAGSALTALTTSFTLDILGKKDGKSIKGVHAAMAVCMGAVILVFNSLNSQDAISAVYTLASYTYGPILGMFFFGILCKKTVNDKFVPLAAILAPILSFAIQWALKTYCNYTVGFELILINAVLTCAGLLLLVKKPEESVKCT